MKKKIFAIALLGLVPAFGGDAHAQDQRPRPNPVPTLSVQATGEASAAPDRATVTLGTEAQAKDAASAQSQVNGVIDRAVKQIIAVGIDEKQIQTANLQLYPVYEDQKPGSTNAPKVIAYRAGNSLQVRIENLSLVGKVIDAGISAGANRVDGIAFDLKNDAAARADALRSAVADARAKADVLAAALNVRLGDLVSVEEGGAGSPQPILMDRMAFEAKSTSVQPGQIQVNAAVTLRFRIQPN